MLIKKRLLAVVWVYVILVGSLIAGNPVQKGESITSTKTSGIGISNAPQPLQTSDITTWTSITDEITSYDADTRNTEDVTTWTSIPEEVTSLVADARIATQREKEESTTYFTTVYGTEAVTLLSDVDLVTPEEYSSDVTTQQNYIETTTDTPFPDIGIRVSGADDKQVMEMEGTTTLELVSKEEAKNVTPYSKSTKTTDINNQDNLAIIEKYLQEKATNSNSAPVDPSSLDSIPDFLKSTLVQNGEGESETDPVIQEAKRVYMDIWNHEADLLNAPYLKVTNVWPEIGMVYMPLITDMSEKLRESKPVKEAVEVYKAIWEKQNTNKPSSPPESGGPLLNILNNFMGAWSWVNGEEGQQTQQLTDVREQQTEKLTAEGQQLSGVGKQQPEKPSDEGMQKYDLAESLTGRKVTATSAHNLDSLSYNPSSFTVNGDSHSSSNTKVKTNPSYSTDILESGHQTLRQNPRPLMYPRPTLPKPGTRPVKRTQTRPGLLPNNILEIRPKIPPIAKPVARPIYPEIKPIASTDHRPSSTNIHARPTYPETNPVIPFDHIAPVQPIINPHTRPIYPETKPVIPSDHIPPVQPSTNPHTRPIYPETKPVIPSDHIPPVQPSTNPHTRPIYPGTKPVIPSDHIPPVQPSTNPHTRPIYPGTKPVIPSDHIPPVQPSTNPHTRPIYPGTKPIIPANHRPPVQGHRPLGSSPIRPRPTPAPIVPVAVLPTKIPPIIGIGPTPAPVQSIIGPIVSDPAGPIASDPAGPIASDPNWPIASDPAGPSSFIPEHRPIANPIAVPRPSASHNQVRFPIAVEQPIANPIAVNRPVANPIAVHRPVSNPIAVHRPVSNPIAVHRPVSNPIAVHRPVSNPIAEHRPAMQHPNTGSILSTGQKHSISSFPNLRPIVIRKPASNNQSQPSRPVIRNYGYHQQQVAMKEASNQKDTEETHHRSNSKES